MFKKIYAASFLLLLFSNFSIAQQKVKWQESGAKSNNNDLIQFSGVVLEGDSLRAVPFTSIIVKNTSRGTISDYYGYFSFVAKKNDTIEFSAIGFNSAQFVIPDTLTTITYSLIQVLRTDTIFLKSVEVYPWPSKEQFKSAFLNLNLADDNLARATKNLDRAALKEQMVGMAIDASLNYKYSMQENQSKLYYAGQYPSNNLLNPIAWAKFIKAWKSGAFKK
jgi:CarboxypepD_reg-like domain